MLPAINIICVKMCMLANLNSYTGHKCTYPGCERVLVLDGNMKNRRDVCMARDAGYTEYEGLPGSIKTGCMNSPEPNSRYCEVHRVRICTTCPDTETDEAAPPLTNTHNGIVESILEKKSTRKASYYKV